MMMNDGRGIRSRPEQLSIKERGGRNKGDTAGVRGGGTRWMNG